MSRIVISLTAGQTAREQQLGFYAQSILVQNPTPNYWYLPDQEIYIPPYTANMVLAAGGVQRANILYQSPPDLPQAITTSLGTATFTYIDVAIPPQTGATFGALTMPANNAFSIAGMTLAGGVYTYDFVVPAPSLTLLIANRFGFAGEGVLSLGIQFGVTSGPISVITGTWATTVTIPADNTGILERQRVVCAQPIPIGARLLVDVVDSPVGTAVFDLWGFW